MSNNKPAAKFGHAMGNLLVALEHTQKVLGEIKASGDLSTLIDESPEFCEEITVLEPLRLRVEIDRILDQIKTLEIISEIQKTDPMRQLLDENGQPWYEFVKENGDCINSIKSVRSAFYSQVFGARFDIKDARKIVGLVQEGVL